MNIRIRTAEGADGQPIILGAFCPTCATEAMPMRDGTCGWCDTPIIGTVTEREALKTPARVHHVSRSATAPIKVREVVPHKPPAGRRSIPTDDLITALHHCATLVGGTPTLKDYDRLISRPSHRTVWRRFGSWPKALAAAGMQPPESLIDRLGEKFVFSPDGCWRWTGATAAGYGVISRDGRQIGAHRAMYELLVGPIPEGLVLDHLCRVPACVNPSHLEPVTERENILRGESPSAFAARKTHCANGHEFTPENTKLVGSGRNRRCRACLNAKSRRRYARIKLERAA